MKLSIIRSKVPSVVLATALAFSAAGCGSDDDGGGGGGGSGNTSAGGSAGVGGQAGSGGSGLVGGAGGSGNTGNAGGAGGAVAAPAVNITGVPFVNMHATTQLTATTTNGTDTGYTWTSSDETIATVDANGLVTGEHEGQVTITATGDDTAASDSTELVVYATVPNYDDWAGSGHSDATAEAFNHWNADDPQEIPTSCARCHSTPGYQDYIADFSVDNPAPVGTVIECEACHNADASKLSQVTFPSGVTITDLGPEARCMTCHQGRSSTDDVDDAIATAGVGDDTVSSDLHFLNIHYYAAGATLFAGEVRGGYQYAGKTYDWKFKHVKGYEVCQDCHNPHSLEVKVDECAACHTVNNDGTTPVASVDDLKTVRMISSVNQDYDGDGDTAEGIYYELMGLRDVLLTSLQAYASGTAGAAICYGETSYPYWFIDTNADGSCDSTEAAYANAYASWTPTLLRAAYNYQVASKDPGAFAHNSKYIMELLYDSIEATGGDVSGLVRTDFGHFNGAGEPARHWDEDATISSSCSRCHGGQDGFEFYLTYGVGSQEVVRGNGLECGTCHTDMPNWTTTRVIDDVEFPSGLSVAFVDSASAPTASNICITCHQGRASKASLDGRSTPGFVNIHYLPAGATWFGTDVQGGYEYAGNTYNGPMAGFPTAHQECVDCHDPAATNHSFQVGDIFATSCASSCHNGQTVATVRSAYGANVTWDADGDGDTAEGRAAELATIADALWTEIQSYATTTLGKGICHSDGYPYFFIDTDSDGACSATEAVRANSFDAWDVELMRAVYNYQFYLKEPGAHAHNSIYMTQLLVDSIEALGNTTHGFNRNP